MSGFFKKIKSLFLGEKKKSTAEDQNNTQDKTESGVEPIEPMVLMSASSGNSIDSMDFEPESVPTADGADYETEPFGTRSQSVL